MTTRDEGTVDKPKWLRIAMSPRFSVGPTIPFILGGLWIDTTPLDPLGPDTVRWLLTGMRDDEREEYVSIQWCSDIAAHVVCALNERPMEGRPHLASPYRRGQLLYYRDFGQDAIHDMESLVDAVWRLYGVPIGNGNFSRRGGNWEPFNQADRDAVGKALRGSIKVDSFGG
jgi:hypothetical protein